MKLKLGKKVFQSLLKYKNSIRLSEEETEWLGKDNNDIESIDNIEWLLNEFFNHGLYKEEYKKVENNGKGRIDWARTIKLKLPVIDNSDFLYLDLVTNKNQINTNSIITAIHNNIIMECSKEYGWLFDKKINIDKADLPLTIEQQIILLKKKLRETFSKYQIILLQKMIIYLEKYVNDKTEINLITPYYYYVWEEMIKKTLNHNTDLQSLVPRPYWNINGTKEFTRQIPDVLLERNNNLIILDAKYYSIISNNINKLPGWESIVKQMYYNLSVNNIYSNIQNIFIMPEFINKDYRYIGKTAVEGKEDTFGYVYAFSMNLEKVLKAYLNEKDLNKILTNILNYGDFKI
ncbi:LlaJI family restriction endonuclease [Mammaliicoccus sciuri]|nr:LlaJI family restriction endonuclease [Mammaliicoccus sciuri]